MSSDDKAKRRRHFYIKRQQFFDEIMFDHGNSAVPALTAFERNVALMIAKSESPDTGETFESASSFAKRLGGKTKVRQVESAMNVLEAREWLRVEPRSGRVYLSIRVKGLHGHRSTKLPDKRYEARQRQISAALECAELSHAERQSYIGLISICDAAGIWHEGQREAAFYLGMPQKSFNRAMQHLQKFGAMYIDADMLMPLPIITVAERDGKLVEEPLPNGNPRATGGVFSPQPSENTGASSSNATHLSEHYEVSNARAKGEQEVSKGESDLPAKSMGSAPTPLTPVTPETPVPTPSESAPSPAATERSDQPSAVKGGKLVFTSDEWDRFYQLVNLIVDNSSGKRSDDTGEVINPHKTGAGIIAVSGGPGYAAGGEVGDEVYSYPYDWAELQKFAHAGLLIRRGDRYYISTLGWQAYDWVEQQSQKEAA